MTSTSSRKPPPKSNAKAKAAAKKKPPVVWLVVAGVVVLAAVIAVAASGGGDGGSGGGGGTASGVEQTRPVEITGDPVPVLGDDVGSADPGVGVTIPTVKGASFDGTPVTIDADGHPKIVLFAAHWCPHCRREIPLLSEHLKKNPLPGGVDLITVATGTNAQAPNYPPSDWLADNPLPGKVLADSEKSETALAFGLPGYPYFVAVDRDGKIVARTSGEITTDQFDDLVQQATAAT